MSIEIMNAKDVSHILLLLSIYDTHMVLQHFGPVDFRRITFMTSGLPFSLYKRIALYYPQLNLVNINELSVHTNHNFPIAHIVNAFELDSKSTTR